MMQSIRGSAVAAALVACAVQTVPVEVAAQGDPCALPRARPAELGLDPAAVDSLVALARAARSDGLVILKDGHLAGEWTFGSEAGPIQTMSATKSVVGLAVGQLLERGHVDSLDQPVADFFPQWRQGRKRDITLRMILAHTSGLQNVPNAGAEIYPAPDALELALAAELEAEPGSEWAYNNKAVNLLAGIFEESADTAMDAWVYEELFAPLCIQTRTWYTDAGGVPHAMAGVELTPLELARIGQLMLQDGRWADEQVVPATWIRRLTTPSQPMQPRSGLLWWLLPAPGDSLRADSGPADVRAWYAEGFLGNYLVVIPSRQLVVVRMKRQAEDFERAHAMPGFPRLVRDLFLRDAR